ncbi:MAG: ABC transporter permease [Anaerocolumna sp.]
MRISDLIKIGLRNLKRRKARTALTVVGVIIGTISIVVMISIGIGMKSSYTSQVMELGSLTTINVQGTAYITDENGNYTGSQQLKLDDNLVEQIKGIEHVKTAAPMISTNAMLYTGKFESYIQVYAIDSSSIEAMDFPALTVGEYPTPLNHSPILFGSDTLMNFYNPNSRNYETKQVDLTTDKVTFGFNPYQYMLNENKKPFSLKIEEYGLMEKMNDYEYDYGVYIDMTYFRQLYQKYVSTLKSEERKKAMSAVTNYSTIKVIVDNFKNVEEVQEQIEQLGYQTNSLAKVLSPMISTANMLQTVLGCIGAVAMLVSAINIANTMIMSIYERTKEIGVMKVLGCLVKDIKKLFLFEAGMIGLMGGAIGIALSYLASWAINKFGQPLFQALMAGNYMFNGEATEFSIIPIWLPFLAAGLGILVGIVSGYYPASRATKISAIEAMKTEG